MKVLRDYYNEILDLTKLVDIKCDFNATALKSSFRTNSGVGVGVGIIGCERKIVILSMSEKSSKIQMK